MHDTAEILTINYLSVPLNAIISDNDNIETKSLLSPQEHQGDECQ